MAYTYYTSIDIKSAAVGANETDFPVALVLTDVRFATIANGGKIQNTDATGGASGSLTVPADFVVSPNSDGSSPYDFEFVAYTAATGYMELWVEITSLSSGTDTTIYLCYGDSGVAASQENVAGTWNAGYKGVWHLHGASAVACVDSTGNSNDPSGDDNTPTYQQSGQIGYGVDLDGGGLPNADRINVPHSADFAFAADFTLEAWVNPDNTDYDGRVLYHYDTTSTDGYYLTQNSTGDGEWQFVWFVGGTAKICSSDVAPSGSWQHIAGSRVSDVGTLYVNGVAQADTETLTGAIDSEESLYFGADLNINWGIAGLIDEIRISTGERDSDWLLTSYTNQASTAPNGTFWSALASEVIISESVCWGHITGVLEDSTLTFDTHWTGTGDIERAGDDEQLALSTGENMESGVVKTGAGLFELDQNFYQAGDDVTLKYRHGATLVACEAAAYGAYVAPFDSLGFVQVRLESTL